MARRIEAITIAVSRTRLQRHRQQDEEQAQDHQRAGDQLLSFSSRSSPSSWSTSKVHGEGRLGLDARQLVRAGAG